jgi:DNA-binding XRE family transcriptional regulator
MTKLRELREKLYISQEELAKRAVVSKATVIRLEKGRNKPNWVTIRKLAAALGVEPGQIDFPYSVGNSLENEKPLSKVLWGQPAPSSSPRDE